MRRRLVLATRFMLPVFLAVAVGIVHHVSTDGEPSTRPSVSVGDCFTVIGSSDRLKGVSCHSHSAEVSVVAVVPGLAWTGNAPCPEQTDTFLAGEQFGDIAKVACGVNLKGPHPGAPGAGGGVVRGGDCIARPDGLLPRAMEQPCGRPDQLVVLARMDASAACPPGASGSATLTDPGLPRPKLCLAPAVGHHA